MAASFNAIWGLMGRRVETTDRGLLLWIRWLFFGILGLLLLYNRVSAPDPVPFMRWELLLGVVYGLSNIVLTGLFHRGFNADRWSGWIFIGDILVVASVLLRSTGSDTDLYILCFLIVYLAALLRRMRDAFSLAMVVGLVYGLLIMHRQGGVVNWLDPQLLLRFPFFLILSLFTSYFSEQTDRVRKETVQLKEVQAALARELQRAMVDLRDKQTELLQAEKMSAMGHMAGALAHEIRNPLAVIVGYVEDILADRPADDPLRRPLEAVKRAASRCKDLMENLLTFSRRPKESEDFKVKDALEECITLVRISAKMSQVQCQLDIHSDPIMTARRSEIQQVFINLMSNAVDAMPKGGTLTVKLEEEHMASQDWIKISVQDTGSGIPPEVRSRIFEPFFTTKERGKGTGLGLSIVQDIVLAAQGVLEVQSELHQGTTFVVRFPKTEPTVVPAEVAA